MSLITARCTIADSSSVNPPLDQYHPSSPTNCCLNLDTILENPKMTPADRTAPDTYEDTTQSNEPSPPNCTARGYRFLPRPVLLAQMRSIEIYQKLSAEVEKAEAKVDIRRHHLQDRLTCWRSLDEYQELIDHGFNSVLLDSNLILLQRFQAKQAELVALRQLEQSAFANMRRMNGV